MIRRKLILLIILLAIQFDGYGWQSNFYIEIADSAVNIGEYVGKTFDEKEIGKFYLETFNTTEILTALNLETEDENVLFYFHSMWGGVKPYHKNSLKILNSELNRIDKIISVIWHAKSLRYKTNWKNSTNPGRVISPMIDSIILNTKNKNFVLCHSMGNRVFEGVVSGFSGNIRRFETVILAGADLDVDVFEDGFSMLPNYSDKVVIYVNDKDRLLKTSRFLHKRERLGLSAGQQNEELSKIGNLEMVDVTHSSSGKLISLSQHIYFKNNDAVVQDINHLVSGELASRELTYRTRNYFDLH